MCDRVIFAACNIRAWAFGVVPGRTRHPTPPGRSRRMGEISARICKEKMENKGPPLPFGGGAVAAFRDEAREKPVCHHRRAHLKGRDLHPAPRIVEIGLIARLRIAHVEEPALQQAHLCQHSRPERV